MKKTLCLYFLSMLISIQFLSNGFAQDYVQWHLPEGATMRIGKGRANDVTFSPDGSQFATSTNIGIWIYDAITGKEISLIKQEGKGFGKIAFSPDGNTLAVAAGRSGRGEVQLLNITENKVITSMPSPVGISSLFYSDDGTKLACAGYFGIIKVWEIDASNTPKLITDIKLNYNSWGDDWLIQLSPDRRYLAIAIPNWREKKYPIELYDAVSGELLNTFNGHKRWIKSLTFSPDSKTIVSGDEYESIRMWDTETGDLKFTKKWRSGASTHSIAYSPKGRFMATGHYNGIRMWQKSPDTKNWRREVIGEYTNIRMLIEHKDYVYKFAFSPNEQSILTASKDGTIRAWDTDTGDILYTCTGHLEGIRDIALSEEGDSITTLNQPYNPPGVFQQRRWDINTGVQLSSSYQKHIDGSSLVVSPDGKTCVTHGISGNCVLWEISEKSLKRLSNFSLQGYPRAGLNVRFTYANDGSMLAAGGEDHSVHVWNIIDQNAPPEYHFTTRDHTEGVWSLAFSPDGTQLATGGRDKVFRIQDVTDGRTLQTFTGHNWRVNCFAFSPNNQVLASGSYELFLWHVQSGQQLKHIKQHQNAIIEQLTFTPDGNILIIAARDGLKLYDMHTDKLVTINPDYTSMLKLSVDNNLLISGRESGEILVWDWEKLQKRLMDN